MGTGDEDARRRLTRMPRQGAIVADGPADALLGDHPDPYVRELMDMPRRQAERVCALMAGAPP